MNNWRNILANPETTIRKTIEIIDVSAMQIALVVGNNNKLLGTVTDGDIRRGILNGVTIDDEIYKIMNPNPVVANADDSSETVMSLMKNRRIHQLPLVDHNGNLVGVKTLDEILQSSILANPVVLMAGGLGSRLRPFTDDCPKPLLKVGSKPLLETIIKNFIEYGFHKFYISLNYKAEMIETHFGDGSQWGIDIAYIRETERKGTAGALALLPEVPNTPLIVMNGDVLTKVNFPLLLNFHSEHNAVATMCVREYSFQVPFGVVKTDQHRLTFIEEKPEYNFFVNAGIYVLDPSVLESIPCDSHFDMPQLFENLLERGKEAVVFPVREYWLDIGRVGDLERANKEFDEHFG